MASDHTHVVPKSGIVKDPYLRLYSNGEFIRSYRLTPGSTVVGRDPSATIMVNDRFVSRHHFFVEYDGKSELDIQDLKSRNGTYVNGGRVDRQKLKHGDKISFGIFEMVIAQPMVTAQEAALASTEPKIMGSEDTVPPITRPEKEIPRPKRQTGFRPIAKLPPTREAEVEALPYRVIPRRTLTWTAKFLMVGGLTVFLSAFLAWNAYQWSKLREQRLSPPTTAVATPVVPAPKNGNAVQVPSGKGADISDPRSGAKADNNAKPREFKKGMMAGLDKSVNSILQGDFGEDKGQNLKKNSPDKNGKIAKIFDPIAPESISVQIKMPNTGTAEEQKKIKEFDLAGYQAMLRERVYVVQDCFVEHMKDSPKPGKISVWLTVKQNGSVQKAGIESSTFKKKEFERCIVDSVQKIMVEPPPWDNFTATYTFKFEGSKMNFG